MLRDARLTVVKHAKDQAKARRLYSIKELSGNLDLGVNNPDITTLECALLERMYYCKVGTTFSAPPPVDKGLFAGRMQEFRGELLKRCRPATKMSLEEVVETYTGRRRTIYQNAYNHLIRIGLSRAPALDCVCENGTR